MTNVTFLNYRKKGNMRIRIAPMGHKAIVAFLCYKQIAPMGNVIKLRAYIDGL